MEEDVLKSMAEQLRKPQGEFALQVGEKMNESNAAMNLSVIKNLNLKEKENILEIGMANGFFVKHLLEIYPDITYSGCDYSEIMVEEAKDANIKFIENKQTSFFYASAYAMPFGDASFDSVFTVNTLYFWDDPKQILNEISRILKPKGKLVIGFRPKDIMQHMPFVKYNFTMYNSEEASVLLNTNAFAINSILEIEETAQDLQGEQFALAHSIILAEKNEHNFSTEYK